MHTDAYEKTDLGNGIQKICINSVDYYEMSEERMIKGLRDKGLEITQTETAYYKKHGYIQKNSSLDSFIKQAKRVFEIVTLVTDKKRRPLVGKKRRYLVANQYSTIQDAEDKRATNEGRPKSNPTIVDYTEGATDYSKQYLADVFTRQSDNEEVRNGNCVYRLIKDGEVSYVGMSTNLLNRVRFHMTKGHDHIPSKTYEGAHFEYTVCSSELMMDMTETYFINKHRCKTNIGKVYQHDGETIEFFENKKWSVL